MPHNNMTTKDINRGQISNVYAAFLYVPLSATDHWPERF